VQTDTGIRSLDVEPCFGTTVLSLKTLSMREISNIMAKNALEDYYRLYLCVFVLHFSINTFEKKSIVKV